MINSLATSVTKLRATSISDRGLFVLYFGGKFVTRRFDFCNTIGTQLPDATARPQLAKADTAFQAHPLVNRLKIAWPPRPTQARPQRFPTASLRSGGEAVGREIPVPSDGS